MIEHAALPTPGVDAPTGSSAGSSGVSTADSLSHATAALPAVARALLAGQSRARVVWVSQVP